MPPVLISDGDVYLKQILAEIDTAKLKGKNSIYRINEEVTDRVVSLIKEYFSKETGYSVKLKKCARCSHRWDIIITF